MQPALSPDGLWVVYVAHRGGKHGLRRISIEGGESIEITSEKSFWPAVSPNGRFIAFAQGGSNADPTRNVAVIPFNGRNAIKILDVSTRAVLYNRLGWSPDSKAIIYKDNIEGLWRHNLAGGSTAEIRAPEDFRIYHFAHSTDGQLVYSGGIPMREIVILENFR